MASESFVIYSPRISDEYRHSSRTFITLLCDAVKAGFEMEFIRNFAERMGLVEIHIGEDYFNDMYLRPTPLFSIVFE